MVPDTDYRIRLPVFEGPLDLLLFLIRKNELEIYDIPIESVTRQYIEVLRAMQELNLEIAGEFLVMAATLMEIKSRMLLPRGQAAIDPDADDAEMDPRWELVHQLVQYRKFKDASVMLGECIDRRQNQLDRIGSGVRPELLDRPLRNVDRLDIWNTFNLVLRRLAEKLVIGEIHDEQVTVTDQMEWLLARGASEGTFVFSRLFTETVSLRRLIATFLAMLELTRLRRMQIRQDERYEDIICTFVNEANPLETVGPADTVSS